MPEVSHHKEGMPCWVDLSAGDDDAAREFYGALFGWRDESMSIDPDLCYHIAQIRGLDVAAIYQQSEQEKMMGLPSHWRTYFAVASADETADSVRQAGGKVLLEPFDVADAGRMAVFQDPLGAVFAVWQTHERIGFRVRDEPGAVTWNVLITKHLARATAFYSTVLGFSEVKLSGTVEYTLLALNGEYVAGIMQITPEMGEVRSSWIVTFMVADVDASARLAESLGAKVVVSPKDIRGVGRFAVLKDPQGAVFEIFQAG